MPQPESGEPTSEAPIRLRDVPASLAWKLSAIIATSLVLGLLFLDLLQLLIRPLGVLLAAIIVAITVAPLVDWLGRWLPRLASVLLVYFSLVLLLVGFGLVLVPPVVTQLSSIVENLPEHYRDAQIWMATEFGINVQDDMGQIASIAEPLANYLLGLPRTFIGVGAEFLVGFFVSLYWVHSMPRMKAFVISLFPPTHKSEVEQVISRVSQRMGGYMRGVLVTGIAVGVAVYVGLTVLGVQYALLLALLAFLGEFFPNVGPILAGAPAVAIAFFESPSLALFVLIFYVVIQQIESYILMPFIMMHSHAHIPPLVTTFAVFTGFLVGGVLWAILSIPLSGAILTVVTDVIAPAVRRKTGALDPERVPEESVSKRPTRREKTSPVPRRETLADREC